MKTNTPNGELLCIRIKRIDSKEVAMGAIDDGYKTLVEMASTTKASIKTSHECVGHMSEE